MQNYDNVIIGGGPAGIGILDKLLDAGVSSVQLLEARDSLGYSLSWMDSIPFADQESKSGESNSATGAEFREKILEEHKDSPYIRLNSRMFSIDFTAKVVHYMSSARSHEEMRFSKLICAPGAIQALYGRRLLPGKRTSRLFTNYQAGEMLRHYPFLPGKRLIFLGESPYTIEVARAAYKRGIAEAIVSTDEFSKETANFLPDIPIFEKSSLKALIGAPAFEGIEIEEAGDSKTVHGDALVVDGDFFLERQWRELLGVKWDLQKQKARINESTHPKAQAEEDHRTGHPDIFITGDAFSPNPNFFEQYHNAGITAAEITGGTTNS